MKSFFLKHLRKSLFLFVYLTSSRIMFVTSYLFFNILKVNAIISIPVLLQYFFYFDTLKKNTHNNCNVRKESVVVFRPFLKHFTRFALCDAFHLLAFSCTITSKNVLSFYTRVAIGILLFS